MQFLTKPPIIVDKDKEFRYLVMFMDDTGIEQIQNLINTIHSYDKIDVVFSTDGGLKLAMDSLIYFIRNHPDIRIILNYRVASSGTFLLTDYEGEILIAPELDYIMFHYPDRSMYRKRDVGYNKQKVIEQDDIEIRGYMERLKGLGFTAKELEDFEKGDDIYWYREDFQRLVDNKPNIKLL